MIKPLFPDKFGNDIKCSSKLYCISNRKTYIVCILDAHLNDGYRKIDVRQYDDTEERTIYNDSLNNYSVVKETKDRDGNKVETGDILDGIGLTARILGISDCKIFLEIYKDGVVVDYTAIGSLSNTRWVKKTYSQDLVPGEWILFQGHKLQKTPISCKYWNTHTLDFTTISPCEEVCRTSGPATA